MKVACLGPKGTFSEEAATQYFNPVELELIMYDTIPDVVEAIGESHVDKRLSHSRTPLRER